MGNKLLIIIIVFFCIIVSTNSISANNEYQYAKVELTDKVVIEIVPRLELLSGVLSQTSWLNIRGPKGKGNKYFQELQDFFAPYRNHKAIKLAQQYTEQGFTYDAPPNYILRLGLLPELENRYGYSEYLLRRGSGKRSLEKFRKALIDLAEKSEFSNFYEEHYPELQQIVEDTAENFDYEKVLSWMEEFYGWTGSEFHIVLAPAMFPGGGYGSRIVTDDDMITYQVIRESGRSYISFPTGDRLEMLSLHEWGHSFVNPSVEKHPALVKKLTPQYNKVSTIMENQAYGSVGTFVKELILRAVNSIAVREIYGENSFKRSIEKDKNKGFYLIDEVIKEIEYYQAHRDRYPRFDQYTEVLLKNIIEIN